MVSGYRRVPDPPARMIPFMYQNSFLVLEPVGNT